MRNHFEINCLHHQKWEGFYYLLLFETVIAYDSVSLEVLLFVVFMVNPLIQKLNQVQWVLIALLQIYNMQHCILDALALTQLSKDSDVFPRPNCPMILIEGLSLLLMLLISWAISCSRPIKYFGINSSGK